MKSLYSLHVPSPVGELVLTASDHGLVGIWFAERGLPELDLVPSPDHPPLARSAVELAEYFAGERRVFTVPSEVTGTAFQQRVWSTVRSIPYGTTRTYREIATAVEKPAAVRAIGACNSRNRLPIVIPCHRVLGASGALVGYTGGTEAKRWLLEHERRVVERA